MSRITKPTIHDFKRIELVDLDLDASGVVTIAGKNSHGKSSVLDAIQAALGGKRATPADPIRHGARKAEIVLKTTDFKILRTFGAGESRLEVWGPTGKVKSPQTILDGLTSSLTFDPIAFERLDPKAQAATLREIAGLDTSAEELEIARVFDARRDLSRDVKTIAARVGDSRPHPDAPATETPISEVIAARDAAMRAHEKHRGNAEQLAVQSRALELEHDAVARLEDQLAERKEGMRVVAERLTVALEKHKDASAHLPDLDALARQAAELDATNAKCRANAEHDRLAAELAAVTKRRDEADAKLEDLRARIAAKIAEATFPIAGLAVTDDGVEFGGVPFAQASAAERLRVSAAIGLALNPDLRILLIRDGSLLDEDALAALDTFAAERDCQVWLEVVGDRDGAAIVLEDGRAKEVAP